MCGPGTAPGSRSGASGSETGAGASVVANTRPAAVRERCSAWVAAGSGATSSKAASGTSASTASRAPSRWPPLVARTPRASAPQLASPASAVVRPSPMPVVPAPWRAVARKRRSASVIRSTCSPVPPMTVSSGAPSMRSTTAAPNSPRADACFDSSRLAKRPVSQGTTVAETKRATSSTAPAPGSSIHMTATVPAPTRLATAKGWMTRSTTSCSESTSSTTRDTRSPRRKRGRPAGAIASSRP